MNSLEPGGRALGPLSILSLLFSAHLISPSSSCYAAAPHNYFVCLFDPEIFIQQVFNSYSSQEEIEENNRMGKTRDLFKKIRDTKGTFHAKIGIIKQRSGMNLVEEEDIKKRWREYTEEPY